MNGEDLNHGGGGGGGELILSQWTDLDYPG